MKKGQSALEYLVTYGWAILAIVIVAALLWALGIFNPGGLVGAGNKANGFTFNILDQKYNATGLTLSIGNTMGQKVSITTVTVGTTPITITPTLDLPAGSSGLLTVPGVADCPSPAVKYTDLKVAITYNIVGGIGGHTDAGTISGVCS